MRFISLVILIVFISLSVFGFFGVLDTLNMEHAPNTCLASLAQNGACPPPAHTLASVFFHTNALKVFGTAFLSLALGLFSIALLFAGFFTAFSQMIRSCAQTISERINETLSQDLALRRMRLALVLLEHSPTSF